jgi:hypothetical protein
MTSERYARSSEDMAKDMVVGPVALGPPTAQRWRYEIRGDGMSVAMYEHLTEDGARRAAARAISILAALIEHSRADGEKAMSETMS